MSDNISSMNKEMQRLSSFNECTDLGRWSAINLAKKGWHYDKAKNKVRCHVCHREASLPDEDQPTMKDLDLHKILSPGCPFANGSYAYNIPVPQYDNLESMRIKNILQEYGRMSPDTLQGGFRRYISAEGTSIGLQRAQPIQVQQREGTSARLINGVSYDLDCLVIGSSERNPTEETSSQLVINPPMTSLDVYRQILGSQWRIVDGTMVIEGCDQLVI